MTDEKDSQSKTNPWKYIAIGALGLWLTGGYRAVTHPAIEKCTGKKPAYQESVLEEARDKVAELRKQYKTIDEIVPAGVPPNPRRKASYQPFAGTIDDKMVPERKYLGIERKPGVTVKTYLLGDKRQNKKLISTESRNGVSVKTYVLEDFDGDGIPEQYAVNGRD